MALGLPGIGLGGLASHGKCGAGWRWHGWEVIPNGGRGLGRCLSVWLSPWSVRPPATQTHLPRATPLRWSFEGVDGDVTDLGRPVDTNPPNKPTNPPASHPTSGSAFPPGPCPGGWPRPSGCAEHLPPARGIRSHQPALRAVPARRPPARLDEPGLGGPHPDGPESEISFPPWGCVSSPGRKR